MNNTGSEFYNKISKYKNAKEEPEKIIENPSNWCHESPDAAFLHVPIAASLPVAQHHAKPPESVPQHFICQAIRSFIQALMKRLWHCASIKVGLLDLVEGLEWARG